MFGFRLLIWADLLGETNAHADWHFNPFRHPLVSSDLFRKGKQTVSCSAKCLLLKNFKIKFNQMEWNVGIESACSKFRNNLTGRSETNLPSIFN